MDASTRSVLNPNLARKFLISQTAIGGAIDAAIASLLWIHLRRRRNGRLRHVTHSKTQYYSSRYMIQLGQHHWPDGEFRFEQWGCDSVG